MSGSSHGRHKKRRTAPLDDHLDLVPLIDCVFLLLLFFMLCGRLSNDLRTDAITVPPTKLARKIEPDKDGWKRVIINIKGSTRLGGGKNSEPRNTIILQNFPRMGDRHAWPSKAPDFANFTGYKNLRDMMNRVWDGADKFPDPNADPKAAIKMDLPKVIVELRADCDTEYRVVQEIMMVLTDSVAIDMEKGLQPRDPNKDPSALKPKAFVNIDFTTRPAVK